MKIQQVTEELDVLDVRIGLMGQEIDSLIRADEVTMGMLQSVKLQELISKRKEVAKRVRNITENVGQSAQQKLQVCEVCGAYLSRLDTDRRLADHFLGKIHLGYVKMREDYDRLMKNNRTTNASKTATTLPGRRFV
ncbi:CFC_collapsed_G0007990.mRNA.1.CDS.1 [Saccharomyces cerevisiae]|nr:CFC_collapsed_G0007990.mRNA.1.CDS.1 [Saccharomyces cerevisiae]